MTTTETTPSAGDPLLVGLVETWRQAADSFLALLGDLAPDDWDRPTDLPGWDVRAVASHTAHIESVLAGRDEPHAEIGEPAHVTGPMGQWTEIGVVNRRGTAPEAIVEELRTAVEARYAALLAEPPADRRAAAPGVFGLIGWDWERLLMNRPLDIWMHEQDVRRAVGRPGGLATPAGDHTTAYLSRSLGYVLARKAGGAPGQSVVLEVDGSPVVYAVDEAGRGVPLSEAPAAPTVVLRTDRESFIRLAGGRGEVPAAGVVVEGDEELGRRVVAALAVTP